MKHLMIHNSNASYNCYYYTAIATSSSSTAVDFLASQLEQALRKDTQSLDTKDMKGQFISGTVPVWHGKAGPVVGRVCFVQVIVVSRGGPAYWTTRAASLDVDA